ncbi:hypothetical protein BGX27_000495 [Mortierella sp. AM989]|nr:hypothetical protein BGX27_000495 [Mortierella sp. AM989]
MSSKRSISDSNQEASTQSNDITVSVSTFKDISRLIELIDSKKKEGHTGNIIVSLRDEGETPDSKRQKVSEEQDDEEVTHGAPAISPQTTTTTQDEPDNELNFWWLHIEREITIAFFKTCEEGVKFMKDHGLKPTKSRCGDYYATYDTREGVYDNPIFWMFYRRSGENEEIITLEEVSTGFQYCNEHDE